MTNSAFACLFMLSNLAVNLSLKNFIFQTFEARRDEVLKNPSLQRLFPHTRKLFSQRRDNCLAKAGVVAPILWAPVWLDEDKCKAGIRHDAVFHEYLTSVGGPVIIKTLFDCIPKTEIVFKKFQEQLKESRKSFTKLAKVLFMSRFLSLIF
jgi:hypothetical protein